jgi:Omp85 superfamily domain
VIRRPLVGAALLSGLVVAQLIGQIDSAQTDSLPRYGGRIILLPFVSYSPQTKIMFGVAGGYQFKWPGMSSDLATRPSYLAASFAYTTKGQWTAFLGTSLYTPGSRWWYSGLVTAGYFPVFYYGVGPRTTQADTNLMQNRFIRLELKGLRRAGRDIYLGPYYRLLSTFDVDWQFPARIGPGLSGGFGGINSGLGLTVLLDRRNSSTTPTQGRYLQLDYLLHGAFVGSDFDYSHLAIDGRIYLPVRQGRDVIALAGFAEFNGSQVPIQTMAFLGNYTSQVIMRGVYLGRFRDRHQVVAQADYRGHLRGRFGYVVFGSTGNVFGSPGTGLFDDLKFTYGAGLRFNVNPADPLNIRVDYTLTSFGSGGLSVGATEAF